VIRGAEQRVEHVQLADGVDDVQRFDDQIQRDQVVAAMSPEAGAEQSRQRVLETQRALGAALLDHSQRHVVDERALRRQISTTIHNSIVGQKSRPVRKLFFYTRCKFPTEEITGAQNFNLNPKLKIIILDPNFLTT